MNAARHSLTPSTTRNRRRHLRAVLTTGAAVTAALVIGAPAAASAHVTVTPDGAAADAYSVLEFAFSHGCEGSPTTALAIDIPTGVAALAPEIEPGWSISRVGAEDGIPTRVVYTADAPVESGLRVALAMQVKFAADTAGDTLAFPVEQTCIDGSTSWSELPADGQDPQELDAPAPTVTVGDANASHGDASGGDPSDAGAADAGTVDAASAAGAEGSAGTAPADPVARWLAAGALVAGLAALIAALAGRGRRRA